MCIHIYIYMYVCVYIYIYREREIRTINYIASKHARAEHSDQRPGRESSGCSQRGTHFPGVINYYYTHNSVLIL